MQWLMFAAIPVAMFIMMHLSTRVLTTPKKKAVALMIIQLSGVIAILVALYKADDTRPNELFWQFVMGCVLAILVGGYFFGLFSKR